jgi:hypothetical protein
LIINCKGNRVSDARDRDLMLLIKGNKDTRGPCNDFAMVNVTKVTGSSIPATVRNAPNRDGRHEWPLPGRAKSLVGGQLLITLKVSNFDQTATKERMILQPRHHLAPPRSGEGRTALRREHERRWLLLVAFEPAQRPQLDTAQWVDGWRAVLGAAARTSGATRRSVLLGSQCRLPGGGSRIHSTSS